LLSFKFNVRFSVRYKISIKFGFFEYPFYSGKPVFLVILCGMLKLLLGLGQCSVQGQFMGFSGIFGSLVDINKNFILVGFGGILRLVESGKFFVYGVGISGILILVDFSGNSRLVEFSGIFIFWFGVAVRGNI